MGSAVTLPQPFGRYQIVKQLGVGGMGAVYLAHDTQLDRQVALKVPQLDKDGGSIVLERFYREARSAATLMHPNICPLYEVGELQGIPYLTMGYIEGKSIADLLKARKVFTIKQIVTLVRKVAFALAEAHKKGVIHRDLKPANIMIDRRGEPMIMDFGLARRRKPSDPQLTQDGTVMGTPAYMPPEQVSGKLAEIGPASDIYSLGVILYELLAGRPPFVGEVMAVLSQVLLDEPPPPSRFQPRVDAQLEAICLKALAKKPGDRFASMTEFGTALQDYLRGNATQAGEILPLATPVESNLAMHQSETVALEGAAPASTPPEANTLEQFAGLQQPTQQVGSSQRPARHVGVPLWALIGAGAAAAVIMIGLLVALVLVLKSRPQETLAAQAGATTQTQPPSRPPFVPKEPIVPKVIAGLKERLKAGGAPEVPPAKAAAGDIETWLKQVAGLPRGKLGAAVLEELKKRNPGFDPEGNHTLSGPDDRIEGMSLVTDQLADIAPLRALVHLQRLQAAATDGAKGKLVDLRPLQGLPLEWLVLDGNPIKDLTPLRGMPICRLDIEGVPGSDLTVLKELPNLAELHGDFDPKRDAALLRALPKLKTVNDEPLGDFLKAGQPVAGAEAAIADPPWLRNELETIRAKYKLPALSAALVRNGRVVAASAVGRRKLDDPTPVTRDDRFQLGSIAKPMTATLLGALAEAGVISFDDTLERMFPELAGTMKPAYRRVTIRQLLSHTSGLPYAPSKTEPLEPTADKDLAMANRYQYVLNALADMPKARPGNKMIYSGGSILAVSYVERKLKKPYEDLMQEYVFSKLGMTTAGDFHTASLPDKLDGPWRHTGEASNITIQLPSIDRGMSRMSVGGVCCSMIDLGKWAVAHLEGHRGQSNLLKAETYQQLHSYIDQSAGTTMSLARQPTEWAKGDVLWHNGSDGYCFALVTLVPDENYATCVATNYGGAGAEEACNDVNMFLVRRVKNTPRRK